MIALLIGLVGRAAGAVAWQSISWQSIPWQSIPWQSIPWKVWAAAGALIAALGVYFAVTHAAYEQGAASAAITIERANDVSRQHADVASSAVDACYGGGGHWDRTGGLCVGAGR